MQPELSAEKVEMAIQRFDRDFRGLDEWKGWEENMAHKYAIEYRGHLYPVKKIASLASGVPVSEFSGGRYAGHANRLLEAHGFTVIPLRGSNPDWTRDELILALDLYLKHRASLPSKSSKEIKNLSDTLARLGSKLFASSLRPTTFRNVNSVYMKLMNYRRLDPQYTQKGRKGLTRGAKAEEDVWREFASDSNKCARVARAIMESLDDPEIRAPLDPNYSDDGVEEASEGKLLTRKHLARERNRKLVESKKARALKERGRLVCETCGFDFAIRYPKRGDGFIECHHTKPLTEVGGGHRTHIRDLALVCANCHRMIHRGKPWLTLDELRALVR